MMPVQRLMVWPAGATVSARQAARVFPREASQTE
jgi:hypothetical protein